MLNHRVIPCLLLQDGDLVKTKKFSNPQYVGDPINAIRIFNEKEVDEVVVLDIDVSRKGLVPNYTLIEELAGECFIPLTYGGGVQTIEQAEKIFSLGVEKVCIQSAALDNPNLLTEFSHKFGSQSIVFSLDIKKDWFGNYKIYSKVAKKFRIKAWKKIIENAVEKGAGEIFLNAVDRDGTLAGPDLELIKLACEDLQVPLIAIGGVSCLGDIKKMVEAGADAVSVGSFFVFHGIHNAVLITYPDYQNLISLFQESERSSDGPR